MNNFAKICGVTALATSMSMPAMAQTMSPEGLWQPGNKESHYEFSYCGKKGTDLCAKVAWIEPKFVNDDNKNLVGSNVFSEIPMRARNKWRGKIHFQGHDVSGTVKQLNQDKMSIKACVFFLCEEVLLDRVAKK